MDQEELEKFAYRHGMRPDLLRDVMYYSGIGYRQKDIAKQAKPSKDTVSKYMRKLRDLPEETSHKVLKAVIEDKTPPKDSDLIGGVWERRDDKETGKAVFVWWHTDQDDEVLVKQEEPKYFTIQGIRGGYEYYEIDTAESAGEAYEKAVNWMEKNPPESTL